MSRSEKSMMIATVISIIYLIGIIGKQYMGSPDFGENEDIYQKYMS